MDKKSTSGMIRALELGHTGQITALAFSPRGQVLASASKDTSVCLGHIGTGKQLAMQPKGPVALGFIALAFSPDGYTVGSVSAGPGNDNHTIWQPFLWQPIPHSKVQPGKAEGPSNPFYSPSFSPNERVVAFACDRVRLFDVDGGEEKAAFPDEKSGPLILQFAPDGKHLATGHEDGTIQVWDVGQRQRIKTVSRHKALITALAFSPDGKLLASGCADNIIRVWDFQDGKMRERRQFSGDWSSTSYLAFLPDSTSLISFDDAAESGCVHRWSVDAGEEITIWAPRTHGAVCSIAVSEDGRLIATGDAEGAVLLWDVETVLPDPSAATGS